MTTEPRDSVALQRHPRSRGNRELVAGCWSCASRDQNGRAGMLRLEVEVNVGIQRDCDTNACVYWTSLT